MDSFDNGFGINEMLQQYSTQPQAQPPNQYQNLTSLFGDDDEVNYEQEQQLAQEQEQEAAMQEQEQQQQEEGPMMGNMFDEAQNDDQDQINYDYVNPENYKDADEAKETELQAFKVVDDQYAVEPEEEGGEVMEDNETFNARLGTEPAEPGRRPTQIVPMQDVYYPEQSDIEQKTNLGEQRNVYPEEVIPEARVAAIASYNPDVEREENPEKVEEEIKQNIATQIAQKPVPNEPREILANLTNKQPEYVEATNNFNRLLRSNTFDALPQEVIDQTPLTVDDQRLAAVGMGMPDHALTASINLKPPAHMDEPWEKGYNPQSKDVGYLERKLAAETIFKKTAMKYPLLDFNAALNKTYNLRRRKVPSYFEESEVDDSPFNTRLRRKKVKK